MRVLMFSRRTEWLGGVVRFISTLKDFLNPEVVVDDFVIGQREGATAVQRLFQPVIDSARLFLRLLKGNYDVIHVNPSFNKLSLCRDGLFLLVIRICGKSSQTLCFFHGWDSELASTVCESPFFQFCMVQTFGACGRILVLASDFKKQLETMGVSGRKVYVTTTMFNDRELVLPKQDKDDDAASILFLSRLAREKGVFELIDAFENVKRKYPELRLVIAGGGPEEAAVKKLVDGKNLQGAIALPGYVRGDEKRHLLASSDIFVLPTRHSEGCPVSLLEAMAAGLSVLVTPVAAIPDIVKDGHNGVIIESVDSALISQGLFRLLDDRSLLNRSRIINKSEAWERYSASSVSSEIMQHYNEIKC